MGDVYAFFWCCSASTNRNRSRIGRYRAVLSLSIARSAPAHLALCIRATGLVGYSYIRLFEGGLCFYGPLESVSHNCNAWLFGFSRFMKTILLAGPVAIKKLNVSEPTPAQLQAFKNEVAVLKYVMCF